MAGKSYLDSSVSRGCLLPRKAGPGTPRRDICPGEAAQLSVATKGCQRNFAEHDSEKEPAGDFSMLKVPISMFQT